LQISDKFQQRKKNKMKKKNRALYFDVYGTHADLECKINRYLVKENHSRNIEMTNQMETDIDDVSVALSDAISRLSNILAEIGSLNIENHVFDKKKALKKIDKLFKDSNAEKFIKIKENDGV
jgi:hypothetical protein